MNEKQQRIVLEDVQQIAELLGDHAQKLSGKTLLLTGANGYLAGYIVDTILWLNDHVLSSPCHVIALVRKSTDRIESALTRSDVTLLRQDVSDPIQLDGKVDFIIHAASNASPKKYLKAPLDTINANSLATRHLLDLAQKSKSESVLFFSSSEIYGNVPSEHMPISETYKGATDPLQPRAVYVESKRFGETLCHAYWTAHEVPVKIVRPFHTYGPGQTLDDGRVTADLLRNRLEAEPISLLSDGSATRGFCYISDAVAGYLLVLLAGQNGEAYNIGDDRQPVSIRELAIIIAALRNPPVSVSFAESPPDHVKGSPSRVYPDITKARETLGYIPQVSLETGLDRTLAWYEAGREE